MKELLDIVRTYQGCKNPTALATIVQTSGSSYRRAGARMLILPDGSYVGCLSGGCLDRDVLLQGLAVMESGKPILITYDTASKDDLVFGSGVGCQGVIEILVEPLPKADASGPLPSVLDFAGNLLQSGRLGAIATVIAAPEKSGLALGDRVMLDGATHEIAGASNAHVEGILRTYAQIGLTEQEPRLVQHHDQAGLVRLLVEPRLPRRNLVIFGAGHDAMPLVRLAAELGYRITVVDGRTEHAARERFPLADRTVVAQPEDASAGSLFDPQTVAVIMSHNYFIDKAWLERLLPLGLLYLGLMGPRRRASKMLEELRQDGFEPAALNLRTLHNPVGLDIGGETPEQIALSILAEMQCALSRRTGGYLSERKGPIHTRAGEQAPAEFGARTQELSCAVLA
jgi:xanthine/CO dehydrogenase XdhC/CoxF family maturation factor